MRRDFFELADYARRQGLRIALSTNGTLITEEAADRLSDLGFAEVGISLDGVGSNNDRFRGREGAYQSALAGIRNCVSRGLRVSLRLTITRLNYQEIPAILQLVEDEGIGRVCIYHLAYSGRGGNLQNVDIDHSQTRSVIDLICQRTIDMYRRGLHNEILTVGNHADGVYLYLKAQEQDPLVPAKSSACCAPTAAITPVSGSARSMTGATFIPTSSGGTIHWATSASASLARSGRTRRSLCFKD